MLGPGDFTDYEMVVRKKKYIFGLEFISYSILLFSTDHGVLLYINLFRLFVFIAEAFTDYSGKCDLSIFCCDAKKIYNNKLALIRQSELF